MNKMYLFRIIYPRIMEAMIMVIAQKIIIAGFQNLELKLNAYSTVYLFVKPPTIIPRAKSTPIKKFSMYFTIPFTDLSLKTIKNKNGTTNDPFIYQFAFKFDGKFNDIFYDHSIGICYIIFHLFTRWAVVKKMMTERQEAPWPLASPLIPCPKVHPPASPVPTPTNNPAIANTASSESLTKLLVSKGQKSIKC